MSRPRPRQGDIVLVVWHDAVQHGDGERAPRHEPYEMHTVGWLLRKDRRGISIAVEQCETDATWRGENFIPAGMVQRVEILRRAK